MLLAVQTRARTFDKGSVLGLRAVPGYGPVLAATSGYCEMPDFCVMRAI